LVFALATLSGARRYREIEAGEVDMILVAEVLAGWLLLSLGMDLVEAVVVRVRRDDEQILPGRR